MHDPARKLDAALAQCPAGPLLIAFSGGLDSTVLMHMLASHHADRGLRAIHVNHRLHADCTRWAAHATAFAARLAVPVEVVEIDVARDSADGLEAAARHARYAAIAARMRPGEILVTAHHADDQAETVLLRLMRASGVVGLAAMRPVRRFGMGWLARPLLEVPREALRRYAEAHALQWIDDPANADLAFDRNLIRTRVLPVLAERWPHAVESIAASAALLRAAAAQNEAHVAAMLATAQGLDPHTLRIDVLTPLADFMLAEVFRRWLEALALPPPGATVLARVRNELLRARADAEPCLAWAGAELRRYRGLVYAMPPLVVVDAASTVAWDGREPLQLPFSLGTLHLAAPEALPLRAGFRQGGERIELADLRPSQSVKHQLQDLGVPPWLRARLPVLWHRDTVWAVGDALLAEPFRAWQRRHARTYEWAR